MRRIISFLFAGLFSLSTGADLSLPPPMGATGHFELKLSERDAREIGRRIWQNEGAGKVENLVVWNSGEDFPSLGIGHFIWYPPGVEAPFLESFPALRDRLAEAAVPLPQWLLETDDAPWSSRSEFYNDINSWRMVELRALMENTMPQQVAFIVLRLEAALPKILATLATEKQRVHVEQQFYRVAQSSNGVYALIDYVNFKGEGVSPKERYRGKGWGLLQLLQTMRPHVNDTMAEFARAANVVLTRRVSNAPRDETRWLAGWRKRIASYGTPL
ncbi:MAG: hypothetical protein L3J89_10675 [Gammaproteobacteria bacterium]|nr:hypothetical protein [Gammaproteobacteria bacterium]